MAAAAALPPLNLYGRMKSFFNLGCFAMSPFCFLGDWGKTPATLGVLGLGQWVCVSCSVCGFLCLCEQQKCKHFFRHAYHGLWICNELGFDSHTFLKILCVCVFFAVREPDGLSLLVGPPFAPEPVATIDKWASFSFPWNSCMQFYCYRCVQFFFAFSDEERNEEELLSVSWDFESLRTAAKSFPLEREKERQSRLFHICIPRIE